ncbi:carboxymuconolactone decarboxylase family protein [Nocardia nova SH22a]|uniref:Carboxymuconolactone decarboxylase family protein n=1 Tax=Nocardia nova SH22a TaxID=1415166 RepID=W5TTE8_9NOCA|nr:carboxymuconolactone decarboxylase family protein [Nocardia nova]AHH20471.1 carboxymuconolactone decarboxylase family protein [Nocardia nova SH22a]
MHFPAHTLESAPVEAQRAMRTSASHLGYLPTAVAKMATSPRLLDGFFKLNALFESTTLDQLSREVLAMTVATRNECHLCAAMHTAILTAAEAPSDLVTALREGLPLPEPRLAALQEFTVTVIDTAGNVPGEAMTAFLAHGYTPEQALEVVLGIGAYTLSTLANRLTEAPLDPALAPFAWSASTDLPGEFSDARRGA